MTEEFKKAEIDGKNGNRRKSVKKAEKKRKTTEMDGKFPELSRRWNWKNNEVRKKERMH
jgi:hypothetical protein